MATYGLTFDQWKSYLSQGSMTPDDEIHSSEDEAVASDLDMHALILGGLHQDHECPVKTADEVSGTTKFKTLICKIIYDCNTTDF